MHNKTRSDGSVLHCALWHTLHVLRARRVAAQVREPSAVNTMFFTTTVPSRKKEVDHVLRQLKTVVKNDM